jgi:hypothetical protein
VITDPLFYLLAIPAITAARLSLSAAARSAAVAVCNFCQSNSRSQALKILKTVREREKR